MILTLTLTLTTGLSCEKHAAHLAFRHHFDGIERSTQNFYRRKAVYVPAEHCREPFASEAHGRAGNGI